MTSKTASHTKAGQAEIRKHYFLDKYVIITPGRAKRPRDIKEQTILKRIEACPFCPENPLARTCSPRRLRKLTPFGQITIGCNA